MTSPLENLLEVNRAIAAELTAGRAAIAPGIPPGYPDPDELRSDDCIRTSD